MNRGGRFLLSAPALFLILATVLVPLALLVRVSLYEPARGRGFFLPETFTLQNYSEAFDAYGVKIAGFTALFGGTVTLLTFLAGYPLALFLWSLPRRQQTLALAMVLLPKAAGLLATMFGLQRWLPRGFWAAVIGEVYLILPYAVLVLFAQLRAMDDQWILAARGLGASRFQVFRRVIWPLSLPGVLLAAILAMIWGVGGFLGPLFLGTPAQSTLSVELYRQAFEYSRWPRAASEAIGLLALTVLLVLAVWGMGRTPSPKTLPRTNAR